jgi:cobalt-zinc-cadmium resistance protein CzcA
VPVLAALILKPKEEKDTFLVRWAKRFICRCWTGRWTTRSKVIGAAGACCWWRSLALFPFLGKEFMPTLQEGSIMFRVTGIPSTSLEESHCVSKRFDAPSSRTFRRSSDAGHHRPRRKGRNRGCQLHGNPGRREAAASGLKMSMPRTLRGDAGTHGKGHPDGGAGATQPIQMRVEELISGVRATLALKIYGEDLTTLDRLAGEAKEMLDKVPGVTDLALEANKGKPQMVIKVNRDEAARYGINADENLDVVQAGIGGKSVSTVIDGVKRFDIQVRLDAAFRDSPQAISDIPIRTQSGALVPLSRVPRWRRTEGYSFVRREQLQRYAVLQWTSRAATWMASSRRPRPNSRIR